MAKCCKARVGCLAIAGLSAMLSTSALAIGPVKLGGLVQTDFYAFSGDEDANLDKGWDESFSHGANMRRVDFYAKGEINDIWSYQVSFDFNTSELDDSFLGFAGIDPLWFALGRVTAPQGLENWNSSAATTFMERAQVADTFSPGSGIGLYGEGVAGNKIAYQSAVLLADYEDDEYKGGDPWTVTGRLVYAPFSEERKVLQVGGSGYFQQFRSDEPFSECNLVEDNCPGFYTTDPGVVTRQAKFLVSSVVPMVAYDSFNHVGNWGLEAAGLYGPFLAQAEFQKLYINGGDGVSNLVYDGWYVQASYLLTCESRTHDQRSGTFGNVEPYSIYGAWEIAARFDAIDLSDTGEGWVAIDETGKQNTWTLGLNWYVNDFVKFQANYAFAQARYDIADNRDLQAFGLRGQVRF